MRNIQAIVYSRRDRECGGIFNSPPPSKVVMTYYLYKLMFYANLKCNRVRRSGYVVLERVMAVRRSRAISTRILLRLVLSKLALLGLLLVVELADLGNLLLARGLDATHGFGAEVGLGGEEVGEAQEVGEERDGGGVRGTGGLELEGELDALGLDGVVESGRKGLVCRRMKVGGMD